MNTQDATAKSLFLDALEIAQADELGRFLDERCGIDARLGALTPVSGIAEATGSVIGPYKLMEQIGEGGMGVVYVAEQHVPVRRKVALKVIKPGMDTRQVIARFEAERQALAMMDHPNIAKIFDGGVTSPPCEGGVRGGGQPYFVMELVRGLPITEYCDRERLSIRDRLELFVLVCRAVQHAHQKGIIHRDLKPSNILVTLHDGVPVPKVIDFGVAKAAGQSLTEKTVYTAFTQLVGTPLYMSPEQAEMSGLDVDTRSDIYSLGVLLYELLTGTTPFDQETMRNAALDEMRRIVREEEPPKPSTRLSSLGATLTTVSTNRKADPRHFGKSMRGELDWIVMRALEKDRRRRYETARDFAVDVMRYLSDQPVEACPPSAWYGFIKFARRNRASLTTASLVGLALVGGTAASAWQAVRATAAQERARDHLELGLRAMDELYDQVAERELTALRWGPLPRPFLEKVLPFYQRFGQGRRVDLTIGHALRRTGEVLIQLGRYEEAEEALRRSEAIWNALLAVDPENPGHLRDMAACYAARGELPVDWETRIRVQRQAIALRQELVDRHPDVAPYRKELAASHQTLAGWCIFSRRAGAEEHLDRALRLRERLSAADPGDPDLLCDLGTTLRGFSEFLGFANRPNEAEPYSRRALEIHEKLLEQHPTRPRYWQQLAWDCSNLGSILVQNGQTDEALRVLGRAVTMFEGLVSDHPEQASFRGELASPIGWRAIALVRAGDRDGARRAVDRLVALVNDWKYREMIAFVAWHLVQLDAQESAAPAATLRLARRAQSLWPDSVQANHVLGMAHYRAGNWDEAIAALRRANELEHDEGLGFNGFFLAMAYHKKGDAARARDWYERSVAWSAEHKLGDKIAEKYRAEAAAVLGVKDPPANAGTPKVKPTGPE